MRETGKEKGENGEKPVDRSNIHTGPIFMTQLCNLYELL